MNRQQQAEYLKERLAGILNDAKDNKQNQIVSCQVEKELFKEMAFCFIAKHGK